MTRIVVLGRLRAGVDAKTYEQWVVERDYPFSRALPPIERFEVSRLTGFLFGSEGKLSVGYDYAEVIDVGDMDEYLRVIGSDEGKRFLEEWSTYIDEFVAVQTELVE
jgi:hypothetical protein